LNKISPFGAIVWDIIEGIPNIGGAPFNPAAHTENAVCLPICPPVLAVTNSESEVWLK
jgi:hypothetical protein